MVRGLTAFCTVSRCAVVVRRAVGFAVVVERCVDVVGAVVVRAAGLLDDDVAAAVSRDALERAADCRLGL